MLEIAASHEAADGDLCGEASMMLMRTRLMDSSVWGGVAHGRTAAHRSTTRRQKDIEQLKAMGFRYVLSPQVLITPHASTASSRQSHRVRSRLVSAFEGSLQVWRMAALHFFIRPPTPQFPAFFAQAGFSIFCR